MGLLVNLKNGEVNSHIIASHLDAYAVNLARLLALGVLVFVASWRDVNN